MNETPQLVKPQPSKPQLKKAQARKTQAKKAQASKAQPWKAVVAAIAPKAENPDHNTEWVLARARCISAGLRLLQFEIDEIGISVKNGWITPERAQADLAAIEQVPAYVASILYAKVGTP